MLIITVKEMFSYECILFIHAFALDVHDSTTCMYAYFNHF